MGQAATVIAEDRIARAPTAQPARAEASTGRADVAHEQRQGFVHADGALAAVTPQLGEQEWAKLVAALGPALLVY